MFTFRTFIPLLDGTKSDFTQIYACASGCKSILLHDTNSVDLIDRYIFDEVSIFKHIAITFFRRITKQCSKDSFFLYRQYNKFIVFKKNIKKCVRIHLRMHQYIILEWN